MKKIASTIIIFICLISLSCGFVQGMLVYASDDDIIAQGSCGESVKWTLYSDGELAIMGKGNMDDYLNYKDMPWYSYNDDIKSVTVEYGVESIGSFAFNNCANIKNVTFAETINTIGESAFSGDASLTQIKMPIESDSIGRSAFKDCIALTSIHIPKGIENINDNTFYGCSAMTDIYMPNSVVTIGNSAFNGCSKLANVYYEGTEDDYYNIIEIFGNNMPILEAYIVPNHTELLPTYTISYYVLDESVPIETQSKTYGESIEIKDVFLNCGVELEGWATQRNGSTVEYRCYDTYEQNCDLNLYAILKKEVYTVTSSLPSGAYFDTGVSIRKFYLSCDKSDSDIYYTTDGSNPTNESTLYTSEGIILSKSMTLKAVAYLNGEQISDIAEYNYTYDRKLYIVEQAKFNNVEIEQGGDLTGLPKSVKLKTSNNDSIDVTVSWDTDNVDVNLPGTYDVNGTLTPPSDIYLWENDSYKNVNISVVVTEKEAEPDDVMLGDINGDGKVDMKDATRLLKFLSGWEVEIIEKNSELNADGKINMKDATRLLKHLSGWDGELGVK